MTERETGLRKKAPGETKEGSRRNPYLFIVGCPRSGTTLLRRVVDAHPQIALPNTEQRWLVRDFEERAGLTPDGLVTPELIARLPEYPGFDRLKIGREELAGLIGSGAPPSYSSFFTGVFDLYGRHRAKPLVGCKGPGYVRKIPTLHALWPEARFVHLIRNGRDVCLSVTNWSRARRTAGRYATWSKEPVLTAALWWKWYVGFGLEEGRPLGRDSYHEIRYEDLIARPEQECAALCAFLGVPYDSAMLAFHEGRTKSDPGLSAKKAWRPITPGLRDWRSQMPDEDVELFEAAAGDLLGELGYPRAFPNPGPEALRRASDVRESFGREVLSRGRKLPRNWRIEP